MKLIFSSILMSLLFASGIAETHLKSTYSCQNDIPPRLEWNENFGYCGETSLISACLYYGQYLSQYTLRAIATPHIPQNKKKSQLLLGVNDLATATQLCLNATEWNSNNERSTPQFLSWVKENVVKGYPVAIGVYTNEFLFYGNSNPNAGDSDYDHIVPIIGISSFHSLNDYSYYPGDRIFFSDNGLWGNAAAPPYYFDFTFSSFQANRKGANRKKGPIYSLSNNGRNYGIAITGVSDLNGDTLPIRITTDVNRENPPIKNGSSTRPPSMPLTLTITVSNLTPFVPYCLYRYHDLPSIPDCNFNEHAGQAYEKWEFEIHSGSKYIITEKINSDEIAIYRAVKKSAP